MVECHERWYRIKITSHARHTIRTETFLSFFLSSVSGRIRTWLAGRLEWIVRKTNLSRIRLSTVLCVAWQRWVSGPGLPASTISRTGYLALHSYLARHIGAGGISKQPANLPPPIFQFRCLVPPILFRLSPLVIRESAF